MTFSHKDAIGYIPGKGLPDENPARLIEYINLKLGIRGCPVFRDAPEKELLELCGSLLENFREKNRLLTDYLCPADQRIQNFLEELLGEHTPDGNGVLLPTACMILERHGLARTLSIPPDRDAYDSGIITSYRVHQGICHNPLRDRRTTQGVFHIVENGFPVPDDKKAVPIPVFGKILKHALNPPRELLRLPFTASQQEQAEIFTSLYLRPLVSPEVPGVSGAKSLEVRFFAPGSMVANLDFVESVFGNAGDPFLAENDAALDFDHWSGHTGCVILAPHLIRVTKKELGLPHISDASPRALRDGMAWEKEDEIYNNGGAFKITARNHRGVVVTIIADNYFGYCKKEVKTMISYSANLQGMAEEEHAGGAIAFPSYDLGEHFSYRDYHDHTYHTFDHMVALHGEHMKVHPDGYAVDRDFDTIFYIDQNVQIDLRKQLITWERDGTTKSLKLLPRNTYVLPSGYKVEMVRPMAGQRWRLVGTTAEGLFCHKPCTVSGGGKSEISKPITDSIFSGPIITSNFKADFARALEIIHKNFAGRYKDPTMNNVESRPLLSPKRSLGSVVRLLSPNPDYTDFYNDWVNSIPRSIRDLVLTIKRYYKPDWEEDWPRRFSVDTINGHPDFELKYRKQKLMTSYMRVGFNEDGSWRTFSLRKDFSAAVKLQTEDDISVSTVVPSEHVAQVAGRARGPSMKFIRNCEFRLFQRPDEAIIRGYDKKAESDFSQKGNFFSNYEPLTRKDGLEMMEDAIAFDEFTEPMQRIVRDFLAEEKTSYFVSTSHPRVIDGKPTQNPRYLQNRPDLEEPRKWYLAEMGQRLARGVPPDQSVLNPVDAVLPGRRNNPPDRAAHIRSLAVYNPIHYQELPELFMDYIASLTGKSPSTTGAGSEGALTKGPFNNLPPIIDLNYAFVSMLLTGHDGFSSAAGHIGPKYRVDHDISMLIPEIWSRMHRSERDARYLIDNGYLEPLHDFEYQGKLIPASRMGYRMTMKFATNLFGRVFSNPGQVFTEEMLRPELQDLESFADGILNITDTHKKVALSYFADHTVELACPPLKALLHIMAHGHYQGMNERDPTFRALFSLDAMLASEWYTDRLKARQQVEIRHTRRVLDYMHEWVKGPNIQVLLDRINVPTRLRRAEEHLATVSAPDYWQSYSGTLGTDPAVLG